MADVPLARRAARAAPGKGLDALPMFFCRLLGRREPARMDWKRYAVALLAFNLALFAITFALLYAQHKIPLLNPDNKGSLGALGYKIGDDDHPGADTGVIFNTVCSFVTNTNLQHYSGEQHLSYFSQLAGIVWLMFVTPASGLCVMLATLRGLRGDKDLGDFYVDLMRGLLLVFLPYCLIVAILLIGVGRADDLPGRGHGHDARRRGDEVRDPDDLPAARWRRWSRSSSRAPTAAASSGRTRRTRSRTRAPGATCCRSSRSSCCRWPRWSWPG